MLELVTPSPSFGVTTTSFESTFTTSRCTSTPQHLILLQRDLSMYVSSVPKQPVTSPNTVSNQAPFFSTKSGDGQATSFVVVKHSTGHVTPAIC